MNKDDKPTSSHYLWAVGLDIEEFSAGTMFGDRYRVVDAQIVEDTQPYQFPEAPEELPIDAITYLKLSRLLLNLPRPYAVLQWEEAIGTAQVILLENVPIDAQGELLPNLRSSWASATPLRQVNLLWQVLQLWQPLAQQNMCATLLEQDFLRVDGPWLRVLELKPDATATELTQLGDRWVEWLDDLDKSKVDEDYYELLAEFFYDLGRGDLEISDAIDRIDAIANRIFEDVPLTVRIASATDVGLRRDHNEDACYPYPEQQNREAQPDILRDRLAIICDGLGGHEGGEVASAMAIATIERLLKTLLQQVEDESEPFSADSFMEQLVKIVQLVNDQIVALNDQQQRLAQQRMGTTLVMAVIPRPYGKFGSEVYIVGVGDSRVYWLDRHGCKQVTLDDDVATRDSVMGYNLYAYSSQRADGGALIQALGTRSSDLLIPRVQRLRIDDDFLLLLCSDGLSDFDRVEQLWKIHIQPALTENLSLSGTCKDLIEQSNKLNGHDNVTIALMRGRLAEPDPNEEAPTVETLIPAAALASDDDDTAGDAPSDKPTKAGKSKSSALVAAGKDPDSEQNQNEAGMDFEDEPDAAAVAETLVTKRQGGAGFFVVLVGLILIGGAAAVLIPQSNRWLGEQFPWLEQYLTLVRGDRIKPSVSPAEENGSEPTEGANETEPNPERSPDPETNPEQNPETEPSSNNPGGDETSTNDSADSPSETDRRSNPGGDGKETDVINTENIADPVES
ncbi:protein serine/threonine phosphatase [Thalassoporum mexicanum PCC 7367]|uniref:PP2C family protein-serine/threonine phosphatase n=1 Tax=Thalassoporum mexicanum TaxID=3457544 RepID=UPI00029FB209|nr:protein phosphatase 2C domain-containing protein [Pseudanabaena sp. PCC 7367]AFY68724.1 protein serine/threonine phosphatase [Pseudanabaena sp. PCC 7367]